MSADSDTITHRCGCCGDPIDSSEASCGRCDYRGCDNCAGIGAGPIDPTPTPCPDCGADRADAYAHDPDRCPHVRRCGHSGCRIPTFADERACPDHGAF